MRDKSNLGRLKKYILKKWWVSFGEGSRLSSFLGEESIAVWQAAQVVLLGPSLQTDARKPNPINKTNIKANTTVLTSVRPPGSTQTLSGILKASPEQALTERFQKFACRGETQVRRVDLDVWHTQTHT